MNLTPTRAMITVTVAIAGALLLNACTPLIAATPDSPATTERISEYPRTIQVPGTRDEPATTLTIEAEPRAIAALDYESAEVIAALGYADRLVLVPEAVLNPALGGHIEEMERVPATFPVAMALDTESVISAAPDLVVVTPRHGADEKIGAVLAQAGLTTLVLPNAWMSAEHLIENIGLIGEAVGAESEASELATELGAGLLEPQTSPEKQADADPPRVLMLTNQAGRPFITAGDAFPIQLLERSGATSISTELGIQVTGPIAVEQIMRANPDGIVLIDMNGTGDRMFAEVLEHPALSDLAGLTEERVLRVTGREVQALGLQATLGGLDRLRTWAASLD